MILWNTQRNLVSIELFEQSNISRLKLGDSLRYRWKKNLSDSTRA